MKKEEFSVIGMHCVGCSMGISKLLKKNKGIEDVEVHLSDSKLTITYDETTVDHQEIINTVARLGYKAVPDQQ
jgi:copper chaperone CopZ